jgi:hypothetical protein
VHLRASIESCNVFYTGYVPSAEMAYRIENRELKFIGQKQSIKTLAFSQEKGELLPRSDYFRSSQSIESRHSSFFSASKRLRKCAFVCKV